MDYRIKAVEDEFTAVRVNGVLTITIPTADTDTREHFEKACEDAILLLALRGEEVEGSACRMRGSC